MTDQLTKHERLIEETKRLISRFNEYMEWDTNKSEGAVSKALGYSQTTINQWRHLKYKVSDEKLRELNACVVRYLKREAARSKKRRSVYVNTTIGREIHSALHRCYIRGDMGVIMGVPGTGKTIAANHFKKQNPDIILLTAHYGWNIKAVLSELLAILHQSDYRSSYRAVKEVSDVLSGTDRMIIVDEAQFLKLPSLEIIRSIHDSTGIGVVYVGQPRLHRQMLGIDEEFYAQIYSRIGVRIELIEPTYEDVKLIVESKGIKNDNVVKYLYRATKDKYGSLRTINHHLDIAIDAAQLDGVEVTVGLLKESNIFMMV